MRPYGLPLILALVLLAPLAARAEDERRGGGGPRSGGGGFSARGGDNERGGPGGPGGFGGFGRRGAGDWSDDDQEKWNKVKDSFAKFSEENTPNFAKFGLEGFDERVKKGSGFHRRFAKRYLDLMEMKERDSELYPIKLRQVQVEDAEFGILGQMRAAKQSNDTAKVDELKQQLRAKAQEHVKARLDEREHRIKQLARSIEEERAKLEKDRANPAALVDARISELENFGRPPHKGRGEKGGDGKGGDKKDEGSKSGGEAPRSSPVNAAPGGEGKP